MTYDTAPAGQADQTANEEANQLQAILQGAVAAIRRRRLLLLAVFLLCTALAVVGSLLITPKYEASAVLKIEPKTTLLTGGTLQDGAAGGLPDQAVIETEVSVLRSRGVAEAVVREGRLFNDAEFVVGVPHGTDPATARARSDAAIAHVMGNLNVGRQRATYLIDVTYRSAKPERAAAIANSFARNYIRYSADKRSGSAEQQYRSIDQRLAMLGREAQAAEAALAQFRARAGITSSVQQRSITDQQIAPLSGQFASAQAAAAAAQSDLAVARQNMASGGAAGASGGMDSPAIRQLRANRASVQQMQSQLATRYGPRHPQTQQAEQQLQAIDAQINEEASRIVGELESRARAAAAQAGSLSGALSGLRGQQAVDVRAQGTADSLQRDADAKRNAYNRLALVADQLDQISQNSTSPAQIVVPATVPDKPAFPRRGLIISSGAMAGLLLGLLLMAALEAFSVSFSSTDQLEQMLGLKMLANVPRLRSREMGDKTSPADTLLDQPISVYAEAFRTLRNSVAAWSDQPPQVVAFVSTLPDEGKTTCALSFARVLALSGLKTLVIDCDLRRAGISAFAQGKSASGLLEVLQGKASPAAAIVPDAVPGLDMLPVAEATFTPLDMFGGDEMRTLLDGLRRHYDRIVLDTPPILGVNEARTLAGLSDAVVLVVKWQATARRAVAAAVDRLRLDGAPLTGAIMTMVSRQSEAYGAMYYSKRYANYYQNKAR